MQDASMHFIHFCRSIYVPLQKKLLRWHKVGWGSPGVPRVTNARSTWTLQFCARFAGERCVSKNCILKQDSSKSYLTALQKLGKSANPTTELCSNTRCASYGKPNYHSGGSGGVRQLHRNQRHHHAFPSNPLQKLRVHREAAYDMGADT